MKHLVKTHMELLASAMTRGLASKMTRVSKKTSIIIILLPISELEQQFSPSDYDVLYEYKTFSKLLNI